MDIAPHCPISKNPWGNAATPFEEFGGEEPIWLLVEAFYDTIDSSFAELRDMHPKNDAQSRTNLFEYLVGWTGGPQLYVERKGHPRIKARHSSFVVDPKAAADWMAAMRQALTERDVTEPLRTFLDSRFDQLATHIINT